MSEFESFYKTNRSTAKIAEICGGEAKSQQARSPPPHGYRSELDIIVGVDLTERGNRHRVLRCFHEDDVLVAVMAPVCTPYVPMSHLNGSINPWGDARAVAHREAHCPLVRACRRMPAGNRPTLHSRAAASFLAVSGAALANCTQG